MLSSESLNVIYDGTPLTSSKRCYWQVKVWDKNGIESTWSQPGHFTMGLLNSADWKGKWIGLDKAMGADDAKSEFSRVSARMFRKEFSATKKVKRATANVCGLGLFELTVNG